MSAQFHRPISAGHSVIDRLDMDAHGTHTEFVLSYIAHGEFKLLHKELVSIQAGMLLLIPAGMPHTLIDGSRLEVHWMSFCPSCLGLDEGHDLMSPFQEVRQGALPILALDSVRKSTYLQLHQGLCDELALQSEIDKEVLRSYLILLLNELQHAIQPMGVVSHQSPKVIAAMSYIQQNFLTTLSLQQVADAVHVTSPYLATLFKRETGFSVGQWIQQKRMTEACARLVHTDLPVSVVAEQIGMMDTTHFIRQFKKQFGITPAKWRKRHFVAC